MAIFNSYVSLPEGNLMIQQSIFPIDGIQPLHAFLAKFSDCVVSGVTARAENDASRSSRLQPLLAVAKALAARWVWVLGKIPWFIIVLPIKKLIFGEYTPS